MTNKEFANNIREQLNSFDYEDNLRTELDRLDICVDEEQIKLLIEVNEARKLEPIEAIENAKSAEEAIDAFMISLKSSLAKMQEILGSEIYNKLTECMELETTKEFMTGVIGELEYC